MTSRQLGEWVLSGSSRSRAASASIVKILPQEERARELLSKHRRGLDLAAEALIEKETIDGFEVIRLVQDGLEAVESGNGDRAPERERVEADEPAHTPAD